MGTKCAHKGGAEQAGNSGSADATEKKWQDQVDGVSDKWRKVVKKTVHFGEASCQQKKIGMRKE